MPIGLSTGWNQIQFNLADFTRRAYGSTYIETRRVQIHANVRLRRIYFTNRLYTEEELPAEYKFKPAPRKNQGHMVSSKSMEKGSTEKVSILKGVHSKETVPSGAPPTPVEDAAPEAAEAPKEPPEEVVPVQESVRHTVTMTSVDVIATDRVSTVLEVPVEVPVAAEVAEVPVEKPPEEDQVMPDTERSEEPPVEAKIEDVPLSEEPTGPPPTEVI